MEYYMGQIVEFRGHECRVIEVWTDDEGREGVTILPTGRYGFPLDVYVEKVRKGAEDTK